MFMKYIAMIQTSITLFDQSLSTGIQSTLVLSSFYFCGILATPFWTFLSSKFNLVSVFQIETLIYGILIIVMTILFPTGFISLWIGMTMLGLTMSGFIIFPDLLLTYVVEEDEIINKKGKRIGLFLGIRQIFFHVANAIQGSLIGVMLNYGGYVPGLSEQTDNAKYMIKLGFIIPAICFIICSICLMTFPLNSQKLQEMRKKEK